MDDPWGSPWAESASKTDPAPPPLPPQSLLSVPPRAFFGGSSSTAASPADPWADDDAFGGWTSSNQQDAQADSPSWGPWADSSLPEIDSISKRDLSSRTSSVARRRSSVATSNGGLQPLPRSRTPSLLRQPSPDPWAGEVSLAAERKPAPSFDESRRGSRLSSPARSFISTTSAASTTKDKKSDKQSVVPAISTTAADTSKGEDRSPRVSGNGFSSRLEPREPSPSRSSILSVETSPVVERQESPITSIDEDPNFRPVITERKSSGKVQGLVDKYDGLARSASEEPPEPERRIKARNPSSENPDEESDGSDFGDFEEETEPLESTTDAAASPPSSNRSPTPKARPGNEKATSNDIISDDVDKATRDSALKAIRAVLAAHGPIQYAPDLASLDQLLPDELDTKLDEPVAGVPVDDRVITDSFTDISQRKTWYRISRYGSMRKHDSGQDENYHPATWGTSEARVDTLKTVRRWMEEDSFTGRAVLGGRNRKSVFNWELPGAPAELGLVFGRRTASGHTRNVSTASTSVSQVSTPPVQSPRPTQEVNRDSKGSTSTAPGPITPQMATFNWSSNSPAQSKTPESLRREEPTQALKLAEPPTKRAPPKEPGHKLNQRPIPKAISLIKQVDEDDEWGEMVSSPGIDSHSGPIDTPPSRPSRDIGSPIVLSNPSAGRQEGKSANTWLNEDFSTFETTTPAQPQVIPIPPVIAPIKGIESLTTSPKFSNEPLAQSESESASKPEISPGHFKSSGQTDGKQSEHTVILGPISNTRDDQDRAEESSEFVWKVIFNLPDLSYMLR